MRDQITVTLGDVWEMLSPNQQSGHPAPMSPAIVRRVLRLICPANGVVLDPFGGYGTTAVEAVDLGMKPISIELNREYATEADLRVAERIAQRDAEIQRLRLTLGRALSCWAPRCASYASYPMARLT